MASKKEKKQSNVKEENAVNIEESVHKILKHWQEGGKLYSLACYELYKIDKAVEGTTKAIELKVAFTKHFHKSYISKMKSIGEYHEKVFSQAQGLPEGMTTLYNIVKFIEKQPKKRRQEAINFVLTKINTKTTSLDIYTDWYKDFTGKVRVQPVGLSGIEAWLVGMRTDETTAKIEKVAKRINDVLREEGLDITIDLKAVKKGLNRKTKKAKQRGEAKGKPTAEQLAAIKQMAD